MPRYRKSRKRKGASGTSDLLAALKTNEQEFVTVENAERIINAFTENTLDEIKNDLPKLKQLLIDLEDRVKTLPSIKERLESALIIGAVGQQIRILQAVETTNAVGNKQLSNTTSRVADIDFQVAETPLKFMHDYYKFENRIEKLFKWHNGGYKDYLSPCFPFVQSSGMGKTKLMYEFKQRHKKRKVFLVVCSTSLDNPSKRVYDRVLCVNLQVADLDEERTRIISNLEEIIKEVRQGQEAVLLVDEAQILVSAMDGFAFLVLRWWLRSARGRIVGALAGTCLEMCNFPEDDSEPTYARDPQPYAGRKLYDPFYMLCTMGLEKNSRRVVEGDAMTDFDGSVKFGRPLFTRLQAAAKGGTLDDGVLRAILHRLLVGESVLNPQFPSAACCLSVLGTRVQMGQSTFEMSSRLLARGYANLIQLKCTKDADVAYISFLPDPVCAFLAMQLTHTKNNSKFVQSRQPQFWTQRAIDLYMNGLCRPENGNVGLIAGALYLLFCGDVLRAAVNDTVKTFAVPLSDLLELAVQPNQSYCKSNGGATSATTLDCATTTTRTSVSFIQVCRNYLHLSIEDLTKTTCLAEWFQAGCAFYAHPSCTAYDIIAAIRVESDQGQRDAYYPMLVSVKNGTAYSESQTVAAVDAMNESILATDDGIGCCVLLLLGLSSTYTNISADTRETIQSKFQNWNANGVLSFVIVVPDDDCFGCWDLATKPCTGLGEEAELYTSHWQVHQCAGTAGIELQPRLRDKANDDTVRNVDELITAYESLDTV